MVGGLLRLTVRQKLSGLAMRTMEPLRQELLDQQADVLQRLDALQGRLARAELLQRRDLVYAADLAATRSSAAFVAQHMPKAMSFGHPDETLEHALSQVAVDGLTLEFGVAGGHTLGLIAIARPAPVYGFDSFLGLPDNWRTGFSVGAFAEAAAPRVSGAELVVGMFADTLPEFLSRHPGPVAFLHLDADLYSSTSDVLRALEGRLVPGTVVVFDEYFNYPTWEQHEHRAWLESVQRTGLPFEYLAYTFDNEQVVVRVLGSRDQA